MASNTLVANPLKTAFLLLNSKSKNNTLKIGETDVNQVANAKLLGMQIRENQKWYEHIYGKGGLKY